MNDKFAVCGKALLPGKIAPVVVGHVAKELSIHIWFAIQKGAKVSAVVDNIKPKPSPLLQGGLETTFTKNLLKVSAATKSYDITSSNSVGVSPFADIFEQVLILSVKEASLIFIIYQVSYIYIAENFFPC